jgi:hypothetical protein
MGENRKMYNKICDNAFADMKLIQQRKRKINATNLAKKPNP